MKRVLSTIFRVISYIFYGIAVGGGILHILSGQYHLIYSSIALILFLLIGFLFQKISKVFIRDTRQIKEQNLNFNNKNCNMISPNLSSTKIENSDMHNNTHFIRRNAMLTLGMTTLFIVETICLSASNLEEWLWFYGFFFFSIWIYYLYLIWKVKSCKFEDFLLIRLLQRFHLIVQGNNLYTQRLLLIKISFVPLLLTVIMPMFVCLLKEGVSYSDDRSGYSLLLIVPIIGWITAIAYAWSKAWLQTK